MKLHNHILASTTVGGISYYIFGSWQISVTVFLSGIFIDLDHILDYFLYEKKIKLDIKDFFYKCEALILNKVYLLLHSYELIIILAILAYFTNDYIVLGLLVGFGTHIMLDLVANKVHFLGYSFIFRLINKFNSKKIFCG
ncbi:MAG: hypothetical protein A2879_05550 [Omnitrophica WOR_2 bacterium RIFCSPHIGHO2_01_FULL_49_10]|nr:MAG: hypothetical protein A2879_05550 [Omnitrophica WOR_2 bacterium RIFCSPHIGHO2_01_FULL_49_10]